MTRATLAAFADRFSMVERKENRRAPFTAERVRIEVLSGLTVALALVPEAVAFAFVAGVNPLVGLYAAFIVGLVTAMIGGRPGMISGATGALAVVMVSLVATHGVEYLFATVVLMGVFQVLAGVFRLGKFIRLVPHPVMLGFVNGLAIVMMLVTVVTVMSDLAIAVIVGVIVSALAYAWNNATRIHASTQDTTDGVKVYRIEGPLFFGSVGGFSEIFEPGADPDLVVVDFMNSRVVDQSALQAIESLASKYQALGKTLQLRHLSRDCHRLLQRAGQLMVDSDDDPNYAIAVDYSIKTGILGSGH